MIYRLDAPATIEDNDAVRILEWHAGEGDFLPVDALLVELETHKALIEVRVGQAAVLRRKIVAEGGWCRLGEALALLSDEPDEALCGPDAPMPADFLIG